MAKYIPEILVAVAPQDDTTGVPATDFNTILQDAVETADDVDSDEGLILGAAGQGQFDSGLDFALGRVSADKSRFSGSFTRPLSSFLAMDVPTFTFALDMAGNRGVISPISGADLKPITGLDAILQSGFLVGTAGGSEFSYKVATSATPSLPMCGYVWYQGTRVKFLGARSTLALGQTPQEIGLLTATVSVGQVLEAVAAALPTTDPGDQIAVGAPPVVDAGNMWGVTRGFSDATLNIAPSIDDIPDSNSLTGVVKEPSELIVSLDMTLYKESTDQAYEADEIQRTDTTGWDALEWSVGGATTDGNRALGYKVKLWGPELQSETVAPQGVSSASTLNIVARADPNAAGGSEAGSEISFNFI